MEILSPEFYQRSTRAVARDLLGQTLCVRTMGGIRRARITETEAYLGVKDRACHSYGNRRTARTESMFLPGGHSYVYLIYGLHFCLNAVTRDETRPEAVLIRAVEALDDEPLATNGPGKLCRVYGIDRKDNGIKLYSKRSRLWIEAAAEKDPRRILTTPRIGIGGAGEAKDWPLRFLLQQRGK